MVKSEVLIPIFAIVLLILYMALALQEVASTTTDISKYQRVLNITRFTHYGHSELTNYFPSKIPDNSKDIHFSYHPQFLQGGENITLYFETDSETITNYIKEYSQMATWSGTMAQAEKEEGSAKICIF